MKIKLKKPELPFKGATIDYDNGMKSVDLADLTLNLEPEQENGSIKGEILAERLKKTACNASVLDYLIKHPESYPEDWKGRYVYFWGTIFRSSDGSLCVRSGYWSVGEVVSNYGWLFIGWNGLSPSASLASSLPSETMDETMDSLTLSALTLRIKSLENWAKNIGYQN